LCCDALLFLTDVEGVLDGSRQRIPHLTPESSAELVRTGVAKGGMLPKLEAAWMAARENPQALVKIAPAGAQDAVLAALRQNSGTSFRTVEVARG